MISKENETDRFQPFQHIGVKLKAICTDFTHHVKSLLKARFFGTKTAVLNVRLVLSYEENFTQIYFGSKTTVLNVRLPPLSGERERNVARCSSSWPPISRVSKDSPHLHRSFDLLQGMRRNFPLQYSLLSLL